MRSAKADASVCVQIDPFFNQGIIGAEDCLYLNVYTPSIPDYNNFEQYPVMIFIHGGGFTWGTGNSESYGPKFILDKNVILVTLNYR